MIRFKTLRGNRVKVESPRAALTMWYLDECKQGENHVQMCLLADDQNSFLSQMISAIERKYNKSFETEKNASFDQQCRELLFFLNINDWIKNLDAEPPGKAVDFNSWW